MSVAVPTTLDQSANPADDPLGRSGHRLLEYLTGRFDHDGPTGKQVDAHPAGLVDATARAVHISQRHSHTPDSGCDAPECVGQAPLDELHELRVLAHRQKRHPYEQDLPPS